LPSGQPPTVQCLGLEALIAFMKKELNILAIAYVFFDKDTSYPSVAFKRAVNIKVIGGQRRKTQKNRPYKTRRTRKQRGGAPLAEMPKICFGTAQENLKNILTMALDSSYNHIDGAEAYASGRPTYHGIVKNAIKTIPRENLWITWKDNNISQTKIANICKKLGCGYIDLFLVHHSCGTASDFTEFKKAQEAGLIRYYGVSNCEDIETIRVLKQEHNIFANQIQARPPGGRIENRKSLPPDFIEQCNALGVAVMLFATISGVSNAESMDYDYWPNNVKNINKYYIDKYIKSSPNVLMVSSTTGNSLFMNIIDVYENKPLITKEKMVEIEDKLKEMSLARM
jgi:diketogulonate reductase-like aldo/keto reductase